MSMNKARPIFRLNKIPNEDLLKAANVEIGKLKSYIDELKYENETLKKELDALKLMTPEERNALKEKFYSDNVYRERMAHIKYLESKLNKINKDYEALMNRYCLLKVKTGEKDELPALIPNENKNGYYSEGIYVCFEKDFKTGGLIKKTARCVILKGTAKSYYIRLKESTHTHYEGDCIWVRKKSVSIIP